MAALGPLNPREYADLAPTREPLTGLVEASGGGAIAIGEADALTLPQLFRAMALNPAKRMGLPTGRLEARAPADLVLFDPDAPVVLDRWTLKSKSKNTPFDGARLQGKVLNTYVGGTEIYAA